MRKNTRSNIRAAGDRSQPAILQMPHIELAVRGFVLGPAEKNVACGLHHPLAFDHATILADYRDFVFTYPAQLHLKANPEFFANTAIASSVARLEG